MTIRHKEVLAWLERWTQAIRDRDFETGRQMFAPDVVAFGSLAGMMRGIDTLVEEQWRRIWTETRHFSFEDPVLLSAVGEMAVAAAAWSSEGRLPDGWYDRRGRATLVLERRSGELVCIHSHFSMLPGTLALAGSRQS